MSPGPPRAEVVGSLLRPEFVYARARASARVKATLPSPLMMLRLVAEVAGRAWG